MKMALRILGFKYLRRKRILMLTLILSMASMLFSIMAFSLLGFYNGFKAYLGEGENIVVLYDRNSRTPFTGIVPIYLAYRIGELNGVLASSPEVIAPCLMNGETVFLRGIVPRDFLKLNELMMVNGSFLNLNDVNSIVLGRRVAERLRLNLNDKVIILGVLADRYVEVQVKGIYTCNPVMDDEVLAPLYIGQWMRGIGYDYATLIRFKIDRSLIAPSEIFKEIMREASLEGLSQNQKQTVFREGIPSRLIVRFRVEDLNIVEAEEYMRKYMDRYGLTREALLTLSATIFFFSGATVIIALKTIFVQHRVEIGILRFLGASKRILKYDFLMKILPWSMISSASGVVLAIVILALIQGYGYLRVLSHTIPLQIDFLIVALSFSLTVFLVVLCVLKSDVE